MGRIQVLHVPECPLVDRLQRDLEVCLAASGSTERVERLVGNYPSPTLVIDGLDVSTGAPVVAGSLCRLDLPSVSQIREALASLGPDTPSDAG